MTYKDLNIKISYKSVGEETLTTFINPLLSCTKIYRRSVGFFTSSALDFIGEGILSLAKNKDGRIMICTSPRLSDDDIQAIKAGYEDRELISKKVLNDVENALDEISDNNAKILYMLIKEGILDIKIVYKKTGMYHDKLAVLEDYNGNIVAFVGSANESAAGYNDNYEKIRVYKSWMDSEGRIEDETKEFMSIWENKNDYLIVYDFLEAFEKKVLERVNTISSKQEGQITYKMRDYQIEAKQNWVNNNYNGFFVMATGTGKTITSLNAIKDLIENNKVFTIIAVPYKHLVNQWYEDVKVFFPNADVVFVHSEAKNPEDKIYSYYIGARQKYKPVIVITTIISLFLERYVNIYDQIDFDKLLIVDEAHNFVNRISPELSVCYKYKLGLSATPVFGHDTNKTKLLLEWFGGMVMDFPIEKAIGKYLVNYEYHPIFIDATSTDEEKFTKSTQLMLSAIDSVTGTIVDEDKFTLGYRGRLRAISMAENKTRYIKDIFKIINDKDHLIVYCSDGKLFYEDKKGKEEIRHLEYMLKLINNSLIEDNRNYRATKFTASEDIQTRMEIIDRFNEGYDNIMVAIKCLDEGINIPSIKSALILSSNDNYREFVQRRGRILRLYKEKNIAHIYDVLVMPSFETSSIAEIELRRFYEYASLALNKESLYKILEEKMKVYSLSYEDIKFKNDYIYGGDLDE